MFRQGNMSIDQYEAHFIALSCFSLTLVQAPKDKVQRFEDRLCEEIHPRLFVLEIGDYVALHAKAQLVEKDILHSRQRHEQSQIQDQDRH